MQVIILYLHNLLYEKALQELDNLIRNNSGTNTTHLKKVQKGLLQVLYLVLYLDIGRKFTSLLENIMKFR